MVKTACGKEEKRSRRVFRGDLVSDIALRGDRDPRVDSSIGRVVGIPLKEDVAGYLGGCEKRSTGPRLVRA